MTKLISIGQCFGGACLIYKGVATRRGTAKVWWLPHSNKWTIVPLHYVRES